MLRNVLSTSVKRIRHRAGEGFVYVGNVVSGRNRDMEPVIDLVFKDENKEEFAYKVSLSMRRYDIEVGVFDTYEEAGQVSDNIEKSLEEMK